MRRRGYRDPCPSLPPGVTHSTPNAPWNQPDPPECPECSRLISTEDDHAEDCPAGNMDAVDMAEAERERHSRTWDDEED